MIIPTLRHQLRTAARHEPANAQPFINILDAQLRNYANYSGEDRAALRPEIEKNIARLERARAACGR